MAGAHLATILFYSLYRVKLCCGLHKVKIHLLIKRIFMFIYRFYLLLCIPGEPGISYLKTDKNYFLSFFCTST